MDARKIVPTEEVSASRKLGRDDALSLARAAGTIIVAKGKKVAEFRGGAEALEAVDAMLGPTGNLRAPTLKSGKTLLVGFNEDAYRKHLG